VPGWNEGMRLLVALLLAAGSFLTTAQHADAASPCMTSTTSTTSGASTSRTGGAAVLVRLPGEIRWGCLYWRFADHERFLRNCT